MNIPLIILLSVVLVYLQYNFLSFLNIILIGLLVGLVLVVEQSDTMYMVYLGILCLVILISFVFKVSDVLNAVKDFKNDIVSLSQPAPIVKTYVSKDPLATIPKDFKKMDMTELMDKANCESFAPNEFVDGSEAKKDLDKCASVCNKHAKCSLVVMPNVDGKNNECNFYGTETKSESLLDET